MGAAGRGPARGQVQVQRDQRHVSRSDKLLEAKRHDAGRHPKPLQREAPPGHRGREQPPSNTTKSHKVGPNEVVKVPFPCACSNGTGLSNGVPLYKIKKGDTLYDIATTTFAGLVKYPQIQVANKLPDANNITPGYAYIPLPCSCDEVGGISVVHYALLVAAGSTVEGIADSMAPPSRYSSP
ncbi:LysM domain-containing GPI-anchored protein 2 [Spatholobus suberectus]|nr:LysM domain-containing GPI-anchored protein 2 [Spatholobus suberectus]